MTLENLAILADKTSHRASSWDRTGGNVDCLTDLPPGQAAVLLDVQGPGKITHIWMTITDYPGHETVMRDAVIRMYWEDSLTPSVEVPLGDFFGIGHGLHPKFYEHAHFTIRSLPVAVGLNERAMNCYWPMPFQKAARIEIYNNGGRTIRIFFYHIDYEIGEQAAGSAFFHALFRQEKELHSQDWINLDGKDNYVLLETGGCGQYVGCFTYIDSEPGGWCPEGDDMIFIDHDALPTINGTGTEDYFNNAWGYAAPFSFPYYGCPLLEKRADGGAFTTLYRFHVPDPVRFKKHIKVTLEHLWDPRRTNSYSSVAFWYQDQPMRQRQHLPTGDANHALDRGQRYAPPPPAGLYDVPQLEVPLRRNGIETRTMTFLGQQDLGAGGSIIIYPHDRAVRVPLDVPEEGTYRVNLKPVYALIDKPMKIGVHGCPPVEVCQQTHACENDGPFIDLGHSPSQNGVLTLVIWGGAIAPIHQIKLVRTGP